MDAFFIFSAQYFFVLSLIILGAYFLTRKWPAQKRMTFFAVPAGLLAYVLGLLGNYLYYDPRPFVAGHFMPLIAHAADNGFPSDHTLLVSTLAAVGMYWNKWLGVILWIIAVLVAFSRIYVGLHHPIDVLGSMAIALVAVSAWRIAMNYVWKA
ncbi:MAG TPA: phosphatase PAP2 family protein [Candidatus Paceibacterota bacterium]|nr:phosphatase PAP2 family protein [Candidatus Paceibacterota bacterium]